tara:strand:- start:330 stop:758 length:429 start_codon:yes stop_codon:yes gene_type:complete
MNELCGYTEISQDQIDATIRSLESDLADLVLLTARQDLVGNCSKSGYYAKEAEKIEQKLHTLEGLCPTPDYQYVDKSISIVCGGNGIGFWAIGGNSIHGCSTFNVNGYLPVVTPPPHGAFYYCGFKTNSFTEVTGGPPPSCP